MTIDAVINSINFDSLCSEQDVRTKVLLPLLICLGYHDEYRAEEFPVYGYEGRKPLPVKHADAMLFSENDFTMHREKSEREWVMNHSLIVIELKKPSESIIDSKGQAQFYAMWTRALYYVCTNGIDIGIYKLNNHSADKEICNCVLTKLPSIWLEIYKSISFSCLISEKKPSISNSKTMDYQDYCSSKISISTERIYWKRKILSTDCKNDEGIDPSTLPKTTSNILLLADVGHGKTTCLNYLVEECAKNYLQGIADRIPVILYAKFWRRSYNSLSEGIQNELTVFIPWLTPDIISQECNNRRFLLFIDGIDECIIDKDLLYKEIQNLSDKGSVQLCISCRKNRYYDELYGFSKYSLALLSDQEVTSISELILNKPMTATIHLMEKGLKSLIRTPLYLHMWLSYCRENPHSSLIPINYSLLFDNFINYQLRVHLANKGTYLSDMVSFSMLRKILSEYAFRNFENSQTDIADIVMSFYTNPYLLNEVMTALLKSGIVSEFNGIVDFDQFAVKEYFFAVYLSSLSSSEIIIFLEKNHQNETYHEIIYYLSGLLQKEEDQNTVLNYLEENNLPLYVRCLKKRFNFSNKYAKNITGDVCQTFITQVLDTYEHIINIHFAKLKDSFCPWYNIPPNDKESKKLPASIEGSINPTNLSVTIRLQTLSNRVTNRVKTSLIDDNPIITVQKDGKDIEFPINSYTDNREIFYYNISELYHGIDCAREIAIEIIYSNLVRILSSDILLFEEPPYMQLCYVESILKRFPTIRLQHNSKAEIFHPSFANHSIRDLEKIFRSLRELYVTISRYPPNRVSCFVIWTILYQNLACPIDAQKISFPEKDVVPENKNGRLCEYYSTKVITEWLRNYHDELQKAYRVFVEYFFPTIKNEMGMYKVGPIQYTLVINRHSNESEDLFDSGGIYTTWMPKVSIADCSTIIEVSEYEPSSIMFDNKEYYDRQKAQLQFLNRKSINFFSESDASLFSVFCEENSVRSGVYQHVKGEIKAIFAK